MPRSHNIDGKRVEFTSGEEIARDSEELALKKEMAEVRRSQSARIALSDQIGADTATLKDVLSYLRANKI